MIYQYYNIPLLNAIKIVTLRKNMEDVRKVNVNVQQEELIMTVLLKLLTYNSTNHI